MFSRILVGLDGSERAARALAVAARIARASHGTLILAQVLSAPAEFLPYILPGIEPSTLSADLEGATAYLTSLTTLPEMKGVPAEIEVHAGQAPAKLLELARTHRADLIVLTSHGHTGLAHWALGRVTQKVARHAPVPVLVLRTISPPEPGDAHAAPGSPARTLVALDGSPAAEDALGAALELTVALDAPRPAALWLVRVVSPGVETGMYKPDSTAASATPACAAMAITTYGASGRQTWALGGVAERLLDSAPVPLLLVRPTEQQSA
jgi:nucleotide-binding universal stress UspA family protein